MNVAVTGSAKAVASARTATAWTAWTKPSPMFQRRREAAREAGSSTVGVEMSWLLAITMRPSRDEGGAWRRDRPHPRVEWVVAEGQFEGGRMTLSMTWMTPFEAITSGVTTLALSFR